MEPLKLYMLLLGCTPRGRNTEQHDIFFAIGRQLKDLVPEIIAFWPEADQKIHIDAWREVTRVGDYDITIAEKGTHEQLSTDTVKLFFINLGGYKAGEFEEFHYKMIAASKDKGEAVVQARQTAFYRHTGFKGATSHIDDKYGIDVDDFFEITDILSTEIKNKYAIRLTVSNQQKPDELHLGYLKLEKL